MNPKTNYAYNAYIKDLWLELPGYKFEHKPIDDYENKKWVGRKEIEEKLNGYLLDGGDSGAYLITGYRGMGKTSFVKRGVNHYKNESKDEVNEISISFGQKDIKELDILRQITKGIKDHLLHKFVKFVHLNIFSNKGLPLWIGYFFVVFYFHIQFFVDRLGNYPEYIRLFFAQNVRYNPTDSWNIENISGLLIVSIIAAFFIQKILAILFNVVFPLTKLYEELDGLHDRCISKITKEAGSSGAGEKFPFGLVDKQVKHFPLANPKEIENEIIDLLNRINKIGDGHLIYRVLQFLYIGVICCIGLCFFVGLIIPVVILSASAILILVYWLLIKINKISKNLFSLNRFFYGRKRFIFIFDEIDKIDPSPDHEFFYEELDKFEKRFQHSEIYDYRDRKRMVINILANLKYLITTAKAKFIFIAGREMFDAALADIADRQSAVSSIFHQVINVDSFLKDSYNKDESVNSEENKKTAGLTGLIEEYLEKVLLSNGDFIQSETDLLSDKDSFVRRYYLFLEQQSGISQLAKYKIIYSLQNFIIYLTYRSNGSPKKLVRLIEDLIKREPDFIEKEKYPQNSFENNKFIVVRHKAKLNSETTYNYFLPLAYYNEYRFGFISNLFRPFLASYGNYYKSYSDKILVATPYLLDHIIKFHPFAFSLQNLELVPEVVSETRSPELRSFIEDLVIYLSHNHIRETEITLFNYKFLHRTYHEIVYLGKIFEDEAAAFNFTLDETHHVKSHLNDKIKEQRSIYKEYVPENEMIHIKSITFLNELLGDAHFYDQEYDEAILAYSDAIQVLESKLIKNQVGNWIRFINLEEVVIYLRFKLKLGLTNEKMKAYENAWAIYVESLTLVSEYLSIYFNSGQRLLNKISSDRDFTQILVQSFLAELYLQEKHSLNGTNLESIRNSELKLKSLLQSTARRRIGEISLNNIVLSNFYSNIGTLLFYKNSNEEADADDRVTQEFNKLTSYKYMIAEKTNGKYKDYRASAVTYLYLKKSLASLLNYKDKKIRKSKDLIELLQETESLVSYLINKKWLRYVPLPITESENYSTRHDKEFLKKIAINLYKLGDCLFGSILTSGKEGLIINDYNQIISSRLFKESKTDEGEYYWSFYDFMTITQFNSVITINFPLSTVNNDEAIKFSDSYLFQLVMCIYFWAAQIFIRIGINVGGSFMYRKIIQSFRLIVSQATAKRYYDLIQDNFLQQILQIASWNSNASDRYQIYKYKYNFNIEDYIQPLKNSKHNYLSTSSANEIKEGLILFTEFKLKAEGDLLSEKDFHAISGLISPYNSISSQYIRYHELRLQVEINEIALKKFNSTYYYFIKKEWSLILWKEFIDSHQKGEIYILRSREFLSNLFECCFLNLKQTFRFELLQYVELLNNNVIIDYKLSNTKLSRINLNDLRVENKEIIQKFLTLSKNIQNYLDGIGYINSIISNSIFCLHQIIKIYNGYAVNYLMSYSSLGDYHRRLGDWLKYYELSKIIYKEYENILNKLVLDDKMVEGIKSQIGFKKLDIKTTIEDLIGADIIRTMDTLSEYQLSLQNYTKSRQLHQEGGPYKTGTINMYYLEDDFNDSLYHFSIAVERQRINSGRMRNNISRLQPIVDSSNLYKYRSYVNCENI